MGPKGESGMPEDGEQSDQLATLFDLRRRASHMRRLMGGTIPQAGRSREYVETLERQAAELGQYDRASGEN
jgi:hypothetical protein